MTEADERIAEQIPGPSTRGLDPGEPGTLPGLGGLAIHWRRWLPAGGRARAVVVIAHGAGEHCGRYLHVAGRLVSEDYAVYALDHRGHGRSEGPRALLDRMSHAVADLDTLIGLAAGEQPSRDIFLLGHSMGATISLAYAMAHADRLAGLILSGPLAALEAASPPVRLMARLLSVLTPRLGVIAVDASRVSRDPVVVQSYLSDPLVHHGKLPARTVAELAAAIETFPHGVRAIRVPTLILYGTADTLAPTTGSLMLAERLGAPDKQTIAYDGLYHEILNEPEHARVMEDLSRWLAAHCPA
ncbi:MAG: alpha/beta hydrolase [Solirubrobacteraceae bacterium]